MKKRIFEELKLEGEKVILLAKNIRQNTTPINYYQDSIESLSEIKQNWLFEETDNIGRCGFDYQIQIYKNGDLINTADVSFLCGKLKINQKIYKITESALISFFERDLIKVKTLVKHFKTRKEGRDQWKKIKLDSNLIDIEIQTPDWVNYDGAFQVIKTKEVPDDWKLEGIDTLFLKEKKSLTEELTKLSSERKTDNSNPSISETSYLNHNYFSITEGGHLHKGNLLSKFFFVYCSKGFYDEIDIKDKGMFSRIRDVKLELMYKN